MRMRAVVGWVLAFGCAARASAATCEELLAKAKQAFAHAEASARTRVAVQGPAEPYRPAEADHVRGYVVYVPSLAEPFTGRRPASDEVRDAIDLRVAPGETASFLLGVHALKPQEGLAWALRGPMPSGVRVEFLPVVMAPMARRRSKQCDVVGLWLADGGAVDIAAGESRAWLVRLRLSKDIEPGNYSLPAPQLVPKGGAAMAAGPRIRVRVMPIKLADPWARGYVFGAFCGGADFSVAQYRQMKAHGIEAILWFWGHYGLDIGNEGGTLRVGFEALDRTVARFQEAGLRGPIVLGLGNDSSGHFERALCQAFDLPMQPQVERRRKVVKMAALDDPRIEKRMVEALGQLFDHAREKEWPEIVILPYDEPTERLMDEHRRMVRLFRKHFPNVRLYGVTMDRLSWAKMVLDTDILVANGDWARIRELATERHKAAWFYGSATTAHGYAGVRWRYGLRPYAHGPDGVWFWCYNFHPGDPWNDFDSHTPDSAWVICWPPLAKDGPSVSTLAYEGLREAVTDVRYAMTLEAALAKSHGPKADETRAAYAAWRRKLQGASPKPEDIPRLRDPLIDWLLALQ